MVIFRAPSVGYNSKNFFTNIFKVTSVLYIYAIYLILIFGQYLRKLIFATRLNCNNISDIDRSISSEKEIIPKSVNYHFTRLCNYSCGFCFHTAKTSYMLKLKEVKDGLQLLKYAGMEKINFSGGEPFMPSRGKHLGEMVKFCKLELKLRSVTIVSNGSMITEKWFRQYGEFVDILAISCDSFVEDTNKLIGRGQGEKNHIEQLLRVKNWCEAYKVLFKINTVVNTYNFEEDMNKIIMELNPVRWKVFQCLLIDGENAGPQAIRNAEHFYITDEVFEQFLKTHEKVPFIVPESNLKMQNSYLILDEYMRFLDCRGGAKIPSKSILDVGVASALLFSGFDEEMFKKRGGIYKWSKEAHQLDW